MKTGCSRYKKVGVAILYAFLSSMAFNFFWLPGGIYANGITGLAQLIATVLSTFQGIQFSIPLLVLLFNIPLLMIAWVTIDREFTLYTILAVLLTYLFMNILPVMTLTTDPMICSIFGGVLHGISVGITLNSDFSTGGLDIIGILARRKLHKPIGSIFILFNGMIEFLAGFLYGWQYAFYSALSVFISGKTVDYVNVKQQKVQVMIVTDNPERLIERLQRNLKRGITVVNNVEGAFKHQEKKMLFVVIAKSELEQLNTDISLSGCDAFVSVTPGITTNTNFYDW